MYIQLYLYVKATSNEGLVFNIFKRNLRLKLLLVLKRTRLCPFVMSSLCIFEKKKTTVFIYYKIWMKSKEN